MPDKDNVATREQILTAAADRFANQGFDGTSLGQVAQSARVTKALVQYHFATKQTLWRETVHHIWRQRDAALPQYLTTGVLESLATAEQTHLMRNLYRGILRFTFDNPQWVKIMYQEAALPGPRLDWMVATFFRQDFAQGREMVLLAQQKDLLPHVDPMHLLHIFSGALLHLVNVAPITARVLNVDPRSDAFLEPYLDTLITLMEQVSPPSARPHG